MTLFFISLPFLFLITPHLPSGFLIVKGQLQYVFLTLVGGFKIGENFCIVRILMGHFSIIPINHGESVIQMITNVRGLVENFALYRMTLFSLQRVAKRHRQLRDKFGPILKILNVQFDGLNEFLSQWLPRQTFPPYYFLHLWLTSRRGSSYEFLEKSSLFHYGENLFRSQLCDPRAKGLFDIFRLQRIQRRPS
ncbi:hypothetical protein FGO68_gene208 [Halteria grandinella]|uniref:Uncharacterized protein n=1 Tax=Halteria grandinella TaxID=5974 RepID=A0A8J8NCH5_HALGN|nr:hypothetical protein FGO68_gene208 [Halteria grandinella]